VNRSNEEKQSTEGHSVFWKMSDSGAVPPGKKAVHVKVNLASLLTVLRAECRWDPRGYIGEMG